MNKVELAPQDLIPARPIFIVGANVGGKPNFMEVGGGGPVSANPPMVALPIQHHRHTLKGILENRTLTVNVPSIAQVKEADYTGIFSGSERNKAEDCRFQVFYGKLKTAPMIGQCPLNLECSLLHILTSTSHAIVIAKVEASYVSGEFVKDGKFSIGEFMPLLWIPNRSEYVGPGAAVGKSRAIGKEIRE